MASRSNMKATRTDPGTDYSVCQERGRDGDELGPVMSALNNAGRVCLSFIFFNKSSCLTGVSFPILQVVQARSGLVVKNLAVASAEAGLKPPSARCQEKKVEADEDSEAGGVSFLHCCMFFEAPIFDLLTTKAAILPACPM